MRIPSVPVAESCIEERLSLLLPQQGGYPARGGLVAKQVHVRGRDVGETCGDGQAALGRRIAACNTLQVLLQDWGRHALSRWQTRRDASAL